MRESEIDFNIRRHYSIIKSELIDKLKVAMNNNKSEFLMQWSVDGHYDWLETFYIHSKKYVAINLRTTWIYMLKD